MNVTPKQPGFISFEQAAVVTSLETANIHKITFSVSIVIKIQVGMVVQNSSAHIIHKT